MGEATFYARARFTTEAKAAEALPRLKAFIDEGVEAEKWWQDHRHLQAPEFFEQFKTQFPAVYEYLGKYTSLDFKDCNNKLAGLLAFGEDTDPTDYGAGLLQWSALVWHFADWDPLMNWVAGELGAKATGWVSDEYADIADCIDMRERTGGALAAAEKTAACSAEDHVICAGWMDEARTLKCSCSCHRAADGPLSAWMFGSGLDRGGL